VTAYGCSSKYLSLSLDALAEITKRFSVEFAIREFINKFPIETLSMLHELSSSSNYHQRRLASEGLRPKLPWGKGLTLEYREAMKPLDNLFYDPTRYVTRSVANHLNDVSKVDAPLVISTLQRWKESDKQESKEMKFLATHALRTLVKVGDKEALEFLGYPSNPKIDVGDLMLMQERVKVGEALDFTCRVEAKEESLLMVDYILYFQTKNGTLRPKVHKLKRLHLKKGECILLKKRHLFKSNMTTRKLYDGLHRVAIQINGNVYGEGLFWLKK
jgi:3-methyladenine DNA glycosylase AlkC